MGKKLDNRTDHEKRLAREVSIAGQREALAALLTQPGGPDWGHSYADSLRHCGQGSIAIVNRSATKAKMVVIGCNERLCPACAGKRAHKVGGRWRPVFDALLAAGCAIDLVTLTRQAVAGLDLATAMADTADAWRTIRQTASNRDFFRASFAGGISGREFTFYACRTCRHGIGKCKCAPEAQNLWRRPHAHLHIVVVRRAGVGPEASEQLVRHWQDECTRRGWKTTAKAQDLSTLGGDVSQAAVYAVKYPAKLADLRTVADAVEAHDALKGLRLVQPWGDLHAAAARGKSPHELNTESRIAEEQREALRERRAEWQTIKLIDLLPPDLALEQALAQEELDGAAESGQPAVAQPRFLSVSRKSAAWHGMLATERAWPRESSLTPDKDSYRRAAGRNHAPWSSWSAERAELLAAARNWHNGGWLRPDGRIVHMAALVAILPHGWRG